MWASLLNDLIQCSQKGKYFAKSLNEKKKSLTQMFSLTFTMAGHESVRNYIQYSLLSSAVTMIEKKKEHLKCRKRW